jgi:hypothetical protein
VRFDDHTFWVLVTFGVLTVVLIIIDLCFSAGWFCR